MTPLDMPRARLLGRFVRSRLAAARTSAALYAPSSHPVGRALSVRSGHDAADAGLPISACELVPARRLRVGADRWIDLPPLHGFVVDRARIVTDAYKFSVIVAGDAVIADVSADARGGAGGFPSVKHLQRLPPVRAVGPVMSLLTGTKAETANYFHWLFDVLPKLELLAKIEIPEARFLVHRLRSRYQLETLGLLGIQVERCAQLEGPATMTAQRLAVAAGHRNHGQVEPWTCEFLRSRFGSPDPASSPGGRMIYINRRDTQIRRVLNEAALETALAGRGFESVSLGSLSFRDQVELFESAGVIVGPHGAGLANLVFSRPGTRVVEILGGGHSWPLFESVARAVRLDYHAVDALEAVGAAVLPTRVRNTRVHVGRTLSAVDRALT